MDLKEEVRRRIADLTRAAYERGYRDGAQSALAEIESASAEDLADQLKATPASLKALVKSTTPGERRPTAAQKPKRQQPKRQPPKAKVNGGTPKAATVQRCTAAGAGAGQPDRGAGDARGRKSKLVAASLSHHVETA